MRKILEKRFSFIYFYILTKGLGIFTRSCYIYIYFTKFWKCLQETVLFFQNMCRIEKMEQTFFASLCLALLIEKKKKKKKKKSEKIKFYQLE